jgi:hypothetical protein
MKNPYKCLVMNVVCQSLNPNPSTAILMHYERFTFDCQCHLEIKIIITLFRQYDDIIQHGVVSK